MKIKFQVTKQDIKQGKSGPNCPIELALIREGYLAPRVYPYSMRIHIHRPEFNLPSYLANWVYAYDTDRPVEPFEYELEVPDYALPL